MMKRLALAHVALLVAWACHSTGCDSTARFARADGDDKYDARARRDSLQVGLPVADAALAPGSVSTDSHRLGALTPWGTQATVTAMTPPVVYVRDFGAKGDGVTDDTAAINEAIASMTRGGTLVFDPGKTYRKNANVVVSKPGVKLWGYGAKLYAYTSQSEIDANKPGLGIPQQSVRLAAPGTAIYGFDIISNLKRRLPHGHPHYALIAIESDGNVAADNRLNDGHGIFVRAYGEAGKSTANPARNFKILHNYVYRTWNDGIHITGQGTHNGLISRNIVRESGDDMIAVINYRKGEPNIYNIEISDNDVAGTYWGRGITISGGKDIQVLRNKIDNVLYDAGILLFADGASWHTANVRNVLVEGNIITRNQTETYTYNPGANPNSISRGWGTVKPRGHAAIRLFSNTADRLVTGNIIRGNTIDKTFKDGIDIDGNVCNTTITDNIIKNLGAGGVPIREKRSATCPG